MSAQRDVQQILVIGAGTMGHGIAQVAAAAGYLVVLRDTDREALIRGIRALESSKNGLRIRCLCVI